MKKHVGDHEDQAVGRKKISVVEIQHEAFVMERGLWGFIQEGQEIRPGSTASAAVRYAYRLCSDKV